MNYGLPYMGSKSDIVASIVMNFPQAENFYDLFGGGFSVSHYMLQNKSHIYKRFFYNEIESSTVDLVKKSIGGFYSYDNFKPEWISREKFFDLKDTYAYVRLCWSFGNAQRNYLFSKEIEPYKKSMHNAVVFDEFDNLAIQVFEFDKWPNNVVGIKNKRLYLRQKIEHYRKTTIPNVLHQFLNAKELQQVQQLERLERLQQVQQLTLSALDYRQVNIKQNSIVYCDIPYANTAGYLSEFNQSEFFDWASSRDFPVYISEYEIKDPRFKMIYSISKSVKMSSQGMTKEQSNVGNEKLYWNGR